MLKALEAKRSPIVLTERRDHLEYLQGRFSRFVPNLAVLRGGMSQAERKASDAALRVADDQERLVLATGRFIGEGFDDRSLDALFLTMPISWKGTLAHYVGRLHRQHAGKQRFSSSTMSMTSYPFLREWRRSGDRDTVRLAISLNDGRMLEKDFTPKIQSVTIAKNNRVGVRGSR